jgi:urease accessory protein
MKASRSLLPSLTALLAAVVPAAAQAHPGHDVAQDLFAGLLHPLAGIDHLVAAVVVGAWAAQRGARSRTVLPLAFIVALFAGVLASSTVPLQAGAVEQLVAASLLVLGVLLACAWRLPLACSVALAAGFAFCHGLAHGSEAPAGATVAAYGAGLAATTGTIALLALRGANALRARASDGALRWLGVASACGGLVLLA